NHNRNEITLTHSKFDNTNGLDNHSLKEKHPEDTKADDTNLLSARDAARLAYHLINDFPESLEVSSMVSKDFEDHTIPNWNWMLPHDSVNLKQFYYEGVDGLKTGHTDLAKFAFTSTAKRDDVRVITVVMKTDSMEARFIETAKLLDYGFDKFEVVELFPAGFTKAEAPTIPVAKGKEDSVEVALAEAMSLKINKASEEDYDVVFEMDEELVNQDGELTAPLEKGQKVGVAKLVYKDSTAIPHITNEKQEVTVDVVTTEEVQKKNWFSLMLSSIGNVFSSLGAKIKNIF